MRQTLPICLEYGYLARATRESRPLMVELIPAPHDSQVPGSRAQHGAQVLGFGRWQVESRPATSHSLAGLASAT
jgi:hypothetical protein